MKVNQFRITIQCLNFDFVLFILVLRGLDFSSIPEETFRGPAGETALIVRKPYSYRNRAIKRMRDHSWGSGYGSENSQGSTDGQAGSPAAVVIPGTQQESPDSPTPSI